MAVRSLWLALVLFSTHNWQIKGLPPDDTAVLSHVLEAEIDATTLQLELYHQKAQHLRDAISQLQRQHKLNSTQNTSSTTATTRHRQRHREFPQLFSDWFEPQGAHSLPSTQMLTQMISFRPTTAPVGRRQRTAARRKPHNDDEPPLQFILDLDPHSTVMRLFHPISHELMWQHSLDLHSASKTEAFQVADMIFVSERSAHLAVLSTSGDLALFKLRLWHNRRLVAGDPRRLMPLRDVEEKFLQCPAGQDDLDEVDASQPPWLQRYRNALTVPAPGKYLHVDVERVFKGTLNHAWRYDTGKVTVVAMHYRVIVVISDSSGGHLSFFHGDNGSFIEEIHLQTSPHDGTVVHLGPIQSSRGLVALATQSRVRFVDTTVPSLVPGVCEGPGRHALTSLATDLLRPAIVYAGTSTGRAFVFKLHNLGSWRQRGEREYRGAVICTLVDQLTPRRLALPSFVHEQPAFVQAMPGFLVLGSGTQLVLYQLSGSSEEVHPTYLSEQSLVGSFDRGLRQHPRILGISAAKDLLAYSIAFAVLVSGSEQSHRLDLYESRIPPLGTNLDLSWIRVPAMMICALAAMFWQQKNRVGGGRNSYNEAEIAGLLSGQGGRLPTIGSMKRGRLNTNRRANDWY